MMQQGNDDLAGIVLAGGRSTRLGRDKAKLSYNGTDLLCRTVSVMEELVKDVYIIGRDPSVHGLSNSWFMDDVSGLGPAGGIMTGLRVTGRPCIIVSCDLPLLEPEHIISLMHLRRKQPGPYLMTTYFQVETSYIEALVSIYEHAALEHLTTATEQGKRKLSEIFPPEVRRHIPYSQKDALPFFNINYPADLAMLRQMEKTA